MVPGARMRQPPRAGARGRLSSAPQEGLDMEPWKAAIGGAVIALGGLALGAHLFGAEPASAQGSGYRECFFAEQEVVDVDNTGTVAAPPPQRTIVVPRGYEVVSGGGLQQRGVILFCRR